MNFKKILGLCTIAACLGCVTLLKGTEQLVTINSNVDGATITLDGMVTFFGLAMWRKFSTNVDAENQTLFNHKCVCGELNRHIAKPMLVAVNLSLL